MQQLNQFAYVMEDGVVKNYPKGWVGIYHDVVIYPYELSKRVLKKHSMKSVRSLNDFSDSQLETISKLTLIEQATFENIMKGLIK